MSRNVSRKERIVGGLLGAVVGDALGLPFEGALREWMGDGPARTLTGGGPHGQPAGTWSDDSSLLLCLAEGLCSGYDPAEVGAKFLAWWRSGLWTPYGRVFGYGLTTVTAMYKMTVGTAPLEAGDAHEGANGNDSLMRTLPVALYFARDPGRMLDAAHEISSITHAHPRSMMCCGIYCLVAAAILQGMDKADAFEHAAEQAGAYYTGDPWDAERPHVARILSREVAGLGRDQVNSGAYVVETLEAAIWSFLHGRTLQDCLLTAVNLGGDTDTVGCLTGGLAGAFYGRRGIPAEWLDLLARKADILKLCKRFRKAVGG